MDFYYWPLALYMLNDTSPHENSSKEEIREAKFLGLSSLLFQAYKRSLWFPSIKR